MKRLSPYFFSFGFSLLMGVSLGCVCLVDDRYYPFCVLGMALFFFAVSTILQRRKSSVVLSEQDRLAPIEEHLEFVLRPRWISCTLNLLFLFAIIFAFVYTKKITEMVLEGSSFMHAIDNIVRVNSSIFSSPAFLGIMTLCALFIVFSYFLTNRNKYVIDGNTLIICEHRSLFSSSELSIPIDTIDEVYFRGVHFAAYPALYINVGGNQRRLYANHLSLPLAKALLLRRN